MYICVHTLHTFMKNTYVSIYAYMYVDMHGHMCIYGHNVVMDECMYVHMYVAVLYVI